MLIKVTLSYIFLKWYASFCSLFKVCISKVSDKTGKFSLNYSSLFWDSFFILRQCRNIHWWKIKAFSGWSCQYDLIPVTWFVYIVCIQDIVQLGHHKTWAWWSIWSVSRQNICLERSNRERLHSPRQTVSRFQHQHDWACLLIVRPTRVFVCFLLFTE